MRIVPMALALLGACTPVAAPQPARDAGAAPPPEEVLARSRMIIEQDAYDLLGDPAVSEFRTARAAVLVRRPVQFPKMVQQPDGSWKGEAAAVVAAVRTLEGWVRLSSAGRNAFDPIASQQLDRLVNGSQLWAEPVITSAGCTDASGIIVLVRRRSTDRVAPQPCGLVGVTGEIASIVLAGQITDWTKVPQALRRPGIPLVRFGEEVASSYQFSSGIRDERRLAIRSRPEWEGQWRRLTARLGEPRPAPPVDFAREMLLMAAMGDRPTGGYSIRIERVVPNADALEVFVREISPGPRCGTIQVLTSPVDIVRVPATPKPVRWVVEREVMDCP